jgi:hypothetical protein
MLAARAEAAMGMYSDRGAGPVVSAFGGRRPDSPVTETPITECARPIAQALIERRRYVAC